MLQVDLWEAFCPLYACVVLNQRESGWFLGKWNSTGDNSKARVQLRHTPTPPLPTSLHSPCHQGDITKGAPVIFFFFSSSLESRQWICTINYLGSFGVGAWKYSFCFQPHASNEPLLNKWLSCNAFTKEINWNTCLYASERRPSSLGRCQKELLKQDTRGDLWEWSRTAIGFHALIFL